MNKFKKIIVWLMLFKFVSKIFLVIFLLSSYQSANALDAAYWNMNRALAQVVSDATVARGFSLNDPRTVNTLARMSPYIAGVAGTAATVVVGAVTAPAWTTVALALGVGAVINYTVGLGLDSLVKWLFRTDKLIDQSSQSSLANVNCTMNIGGDFFTAGFLDAAGGYTQYFGCDGVAVASQANFAKTGLQLTQPCIVSSGSAICGGMVATKYAGSTRACPAGTYSNGTQCVGWTYTTAPVPRQTAISAQTAINQIPAADLDMQLNPAIVAAIANRLWQLTSVQPGYSGLPYQTSNPITAAEVQRTYTNNPNLVPPTIRDFVTPAPVTTAQPTPFALPAPTTSTPIGTALVAQTAPAQVNPASASPLTNLGDDPAIGAPTLESTPTAQMILAPILNMLPGLRSFNVTSHAAICPTPTLNLVGKTIIMQAHCTLIDAIKPTLQASMLFAWAAIALFVILSA